MIVENVGGGPTGILSKELANTQILANIFKVSPPSGFING
jgi:hypothetical protein